ARDAIDDVLRSGVLEIVDSDAYPPLPACVASRTRRRRDLLQELRDVVAQVELDLAEPTAPHDDLLVDVLRRGLHASVRGLDGLLLCESRGDRQGGHRGRQNEPSGQGFEREHSRFLQKSRRSVAQPGPRETGLFSRNSARKSRATYRSRAVPGRIEPAASERRGAGMAEP